MYLHGVIFPNAMQTVLIIIIINCGSAYATGLLNAELGCSSISST